MKNTFLLFFLFVISIPALHAQNVISGKVTDEKTGEALFGVSVYISDLKTGAVTDTSGKFLIRNIPEGSYLTELQYTGYSSKAVTLTSSPAPVYTQIAMTSTAIEMHTVVISGQSHATEIRKTPVPIITADKKYLENNPSTNIIDAISRLPGVNAVTTGPNVSKPFIHGLGYNRILTLYDGIRQEGQQWGDEHGIEVDENRVDHIEVIKGPASLTYGSDAIAGVVNLLPAPPEPEGFVRGSFLLNYQSNNGLCEGSGNVAGNHNGFVWGLRSTYRMATNYRNKIDGRVYGTAFRETDGNGYLGITRHWGYSILSFSAFNDLQEIPDGSRDSTSRLFTKQITEADTFRPVVTNDELNSYKIATLHQHVQHYRAYLSNSFVIGQNRLAVKLGFQENIRREFSHPQNQDIAGLYLVLNSFTYDAKYYLEGKNGWESTFGLNGMYQENTNKGTEFIIPDYHLLDIGPFAFVTKSMNKLTLAAGARFDTRIFNNSEMYTSANPITGFDMEVTAPDTAGAANPFYAYHHMFSGISGSAGMTYNFSDHFSVKFNVARGFRAPNISEISANGVHPGTNIYQVGNKTFSPEFSLQEDLGLLFDFKHVSANLDVFNNNISNYIFNEKLTGVNGQDSVIVAGNQTFKFEQSNAQLYGGDADFDIHPHPLDWLHIESSASMVYAFNKGGNGTVINDSNKYLPFIPPFRLVSDVRVNFKKRGAFANMYVKAGMEYDAAQNRILLADNTETTTPGYTLFDAGFGTDFVNKKGTTLFSLVILGTNITDTGYQNHLSRLKYMDNYPVNGSGHSGIYNMGRNISVKLVIPVTYKQPKSS